ncbi:13553_t:CDS:2, partial [Funneliformis caledonium]
GYREPFTNPNILDKYQNLVHDDPNPGFRPMFSKRLIDLQHVYKNVRKMSGTEMIVWSSFNYLSIEKASKEQYEKADIKVGLTLPVPKKKKMR